MKRDELKEFFEENYSHKIFHTKYPSINETDKKLIQVSLKMLKEWYDNYFYIMFDKMHRMNGMVQKTIDSSFDKKPNTGKFSKKSLTTVITNAYFDLLVSNTMKILRTSDNRRVRRKVYSNFLKGKYSNNQMGETIYNMVQDLCKVS